jgi:hypothetical protein
VTLGCAGLPRLDGHAELWDRVVRWLAGRNCDVSRFTWRGSMKRKGNMELVAKTFCTP